jgi:hypothetical protein
MSLHQQLIAVLAASLSPHPALRQPAEQQLGEWAHEPTFLQSLLHVVAARDQVDRNVRVQAVIGFKNGVERGWRRSTRYGVLVLFFVLGSMI